LKIGLLSYRSHPYSGGQGIYVKHLSKALSKLGNDVSVISGPPYPELHDSVKLIKIPSLDLFASENRLKEFKLNYFLNPIDFYEWSNVMTGGFPEPYTFGKRLLKYLESSSPAFDVLLDNQSLCGSLLQIQKLYPLAVTIHHPITKDHKLEMESAKNWKEKLSSKRWHNFLPMQKRVAPNLNQIICVSGPSKQDIVDEFEVDPDKIEIILNGIDIEKFIPNKQKESQGHKLITTASADIPLKGLKFLIEALPGILESFPDTSLDVIGKSPTDSKIRQLIKELHLEEKIIFHSGISEEEIVDLYHASKVAVIPSLYEGFGFGAGEAMSCGVPLISTHSGGLKEVVGDSAIKIQPGSTVDIERAVIQLFQNPLQRKELSEKGRKRIEELFDWKIAAQSYVDVFNNVIKSYNNEHNQVQKS
jgi:glycosyltransferase involved in cell wall biosynthesis